MSDKSNTTMMRVILINFNSNFIQNIIRVYVGNIIRVYVGERILV